MIKFFRKIRQGLLNEGKVTRYLAYALGEIILVVIGILIALQINNWNEGLKERKQELVYLQNMKIDLESQIDLMDGYINFENIIIDHSNDIAHHYEVNGGFTDMDSIFPKLNDLSVRWTFSNVNNTLLEMMNSGQINVISNKILKQELIDFNKQMETFSSNSQNNNGNLIDLLVVPNVMEVSPYASYGYSSRMTDMLKTYFVEDLTIVDNGQLHEISTAVINEPKNKLKTINNVLFRKAMATMQRLGNESLKNRALEVLSSVESELDQRKPDYR